MHNLSICLCIFYVVLFYVLVVVRCLNSVDVINCERVCMYVNRFLSRIRLRHSLIYMSLLYVYVCMCVHVYVFMCK